MFAWASASIATLGRYQKKKVIHGRIIFLDIQELDVIYIS